MILCDRYCGLDHPEGEFAHEGPDDRKFPESTGEALRKDTMTPIKIEKDEGVTGMPLHGMDEGRAPSPGLAGKVAFLKAVRNRLRNPRAEEARFVDM